MNVFWKEGRALTSIEIADMKIKSTWSKNYVHNILRSLIEKNMIRECDEKVQYHTQYARKFIATITKEEYVAKHILSVGITKSCVAGLMSAIVREMGDQEKDKQTIQKLEEILQEWKESGDGRNK